MSMSRALQASLILALAVALVSSFASCAAAPTTALRDIWAVDDGEKIFRDNLNSSLKSGENNTVWDGRRVRLFAARNEVVAFQLILEAGDDGASQVNVTISDWTAGEARIRGSHPLPEPNSYLGVGVELFTEHYLHVTTPSYNDPQRGGFYWTAAANPRLTGWTPDALIPFSAAPGRGGAPFDIAPDTNQGVWADIYVPRAECPAGLYTGRIVVTVEDRQVADIPLELEVLDFALPDENHYRSMIFYSGEKIAPRHGLSEGPARWPMLLNYHRMAHRHRVELIGGGTWEELQALQGTLSGEAYTRAEGYQGPGEGVGNTVFSIHTYRVDFPDDEASYRAQSDRWVTWFQEHAPEVEYFLYLTDEPRRDRMDWIVERAGWIHNNPGPGRELPVFVTTAPRDSLVGSVDIWCTQSSWYPRERVQAAEARGERVWLYAGHRPETTADMIDEYGIAFRLKPWIGHLCHIPRWFTWESTHWFANRNEQPNDQPKNVFVEPVTFDPGYARGRGNGDGTLFYPGQDQVFPDQDRGYPGPIASIRLKMYRRGVQDVEYMWLAEQAGHGEEVSAMLSELLPAVMWEAGKYPSWSNRNAVYERARRQLAELIAAEPPAQAAPSAP